jgi:hypothetical protein
VLAALGRLAPQGKVIVVFVADLAPGAAGAKHYYRGRKFFYVLEGTCREPEGGSTHMMEARAFGSNPNKGIPLCTSLANASRSTETPRSSASIARSMACRVSAVVIIGPY